MQRVDDSKRQNGRGRASTVSRAATAERPHEDARTDSGASDAAPDASPSGVPPRLGTITVDWKLYQHHLAAAELSDDQKREFLEALWYIITTFVDLGFGIEPVQQVLKSAAALPAQADPINPTDQLEAATTRLPALDRAFDTANGTTNSKGEHPGRTTS